MINRGGPAPNPGTVAGPGTPGYSLMNRRGPTNPRITEDFSGAWQAPIPDPNWTPTDQNPTGSLLRRMGPGDTPQITPQQIAEAQARLAAAGGGNVAAPGFTKVGTGIGTYGQEQRRRLSRGPKTGLSVTPEMVRRAAARRLG